MGVVRRRFLYGKMKFLRVPKRFLSDIRRCIFALRVLRTKRRTDGRIYFIIKFRMSGVTMVMRYGEEGTRRKSRMMVVRRNIFVGGYVR